MPRVRSVLAAQRSMS
jgi:hypothetical protein